MSSDENLRKYTSQSPSRQSSPLQSRSPPASPTMSSRSPPTSDSEVPRIKEEIKPSLDAANIHRGLLSLKQFQEHSFSLVNQALPLLRQKFAEEQIKVERDMENVSDNNNHKQSVNNNAGAGLDTADSDTLSFEEARRRFLSESSPVGGGRLAFSVENILAPGKFGKELDGDQDPYGEKLSLFFLLVQTWF